MIGSGTYCTFPNKSQICNGEIDCDDYTLNLMKKWEDQDQI